MYRNYQIEVFRSTRFLEIIQNYFDLVLRKLNLD